MHPDQQLGCLGTQTQTTWVGAHLYQGPGRPYLKALVGTHQDRRLAAPVHRPKAKDQPGNPINTLAVHGRPQLKHLGLNNSQLAPVHRALQGLFSL